MVPYLCALLYIHCTGADRTFATAVTEVTAGFLKQFFLRVLGVLGGKIPPVLNVLTLTRWRTGARFQHGAGWRYCCSSPLCTRVPGWRFWK